MVFGKLFNHLKNGIGFPVGGFICGKGFGQVGEVALLLVVLSQEGQAFADDNFSYPTLKSPFVCILVYFGKGLKKSV